MDTYRHLCASALAAIVVLRSILAAVFPLFTDKMFHSLGDQWGLTVFAILSLVCAPFPFLFYVSQYSPLFCRRFLVIERPCVDPREANSGCITFRQRVREEGSHRLKDWNNFQAYLPDGPYCLVVEAEIFFDVLYRTLRWFRYHYFPLSLLAVARVENS